MSFKEAGRLVLHNEKIIIDRENYRDEADTWLYGRDYAHINEVGVSYNIKRILIDTDTLDNGKSLQVRFICCDKFLLSDPNEDGDDAFSYWVYYRELNYNGHYTIHWQEMSKQLASIPLPDYEDVKDQVLDEQVEFEILKSKEASQN